MAVAVVQVDGLALLSPARHMVNRSAIFEAQKAWHEPNLLGPLAARKP
ncbi:MAG: hypothetical protein ABSG04_06050 [Verrucomicrobiota bacterium]